VKKSNKVGIKGSIDLDIKKKLFQTPLKMICLVFLKSLLFITKHVFTSQKWKTRKCSSCMYLWMLFLPNLFLKH